MDEEGSVQIEVVGQMVTTGEVHRVYVYLVALKVEYLLDHDQPQFHSALLDHWFLAFAAICIRLKYDELFPLYQSLTG